MEVLSNYLTQTIKNHIVDIRYNDVSYRYFVKTSQIGELSCVLEIRKEIPNTSLKNSEKKKIKKFIENYFDNCFKTAKSEELLKQSLRQKISYNRLLGEFIGTISCIIDWWDIPKNLKEKLNKKLIILKSTTDDNI